MRGDAPKITAELRQAIDRYDDRDDERVLEAYLAASPGERDRINEILLALCGCSLPLLVVRAGVQPMLYLVKFDAGYDGEVIGNYEIKVSARSARGAEAKAAQACAAGYFGDVPREAGVNITETIWLPENIFPEWKGKSVRTVDGWRPAENNDQ